MRASLVDIVAVQQPARPAKATRGDAGPAEIERHQPADGRDHAPNEARGDDDGRREADGHATEQSPIRRRKSGPDAPTGNAARESDQARSSRLADAGADAAEAQTAFAAVLAETSAKAVVPQADVAVGGVGAQAPGQGVSPAEWVVPLTAASEGGTLPEPQAGTGPAVAAGAQGLAVVPAPGADATAAVSAAVVAEGNASTTPADALGLPVEAAPGVATEAAAAVQANAAVPSGRSTPTVPADGTAAAPGRTAAAVAAEGATTTPAEQLAADHSTAEANSPATRPAEQGTGPANLTQQPEGAEPRQGQPEAPAPAAHPRSSEPVMTERYTPARGVAPEPSSAEANPAPQATAAVETQAQPGPSAASRRTQPLPGADTIQQVEVTPEPGPAGAARVAPPAPTQPAPVADQIADAVTGGSVQAGRRVVVRLDPPELGSVRVTVRADGDGVRGVIEVDSARTLAEVERQTAALVERLADQGLTLRRMDVVLNDSTERNAAGDGSQQASGDGDDAREGELDGHAGGTSAGEGAPSASGGEPGESGGPAPADAQTATDSSVNVWM